MHICGMTLASYMTANEMKDADLAALLCVDRSTVSRWRTGASRPDWANIEKITRATNGAVTVLDFMKEAA